MPGLIACIKKKIYVFLKFFGFKIIKLSRDRANFDRLHKIFLRKNKIPIIFDVGANVGQTISRFKKINDESIIHSFEPVKEDFEVLQKKFSNDKSIILNNIALGEKDCSRNLYINNLPGSSSFYKLIPETQWVIERSQTYKNDPKNVFKESVNLQMTTLDSYCEKNHISKIDILKIDTQGYEDKILQGARRLLETKSISYIEIEIIFNDIYEKKLNFFEIEKYLIPNGYELFAISNAGNYYDDYIFQVDVIYFNVHDLLKETKYAFEKINSNEKF